MKLVLGLAAVAVGLVAAGASAASHPVYTSSVSTIFEGNDWSLVGWRSHGSLCLSYGAPGNADSGCGISTTRAFSVLTASLGKKEQRVLGIVRPGIVRVALKLANGTLIPAQLRSAPARLRIRLTFFKIEGRIALQTPVARAPAVGLILGYNERGRIVSTFQL
jgi:hypothetical protein